MIKNGNSISNVTTQIEPVQDKNTYSLDPVNVTTQIEPVQDKNTYSLDPVNVTTQSRYFYLVLVLFE
jgi:hypothetical protein